MSKYSEIEKWPPREVPKSEKSYNPLPWDWYAYQRVITLDEQKRPIPSESEMRKEWEKYMGTFH